MEREAKALCELRALCFLDEVLKSRGSSPGGNWRIASLCTAARQHPVLANPKHPGLPVCAQGWLAVSGFCCMLHTRALSSSLEPEGIHRVLPLGILLLGFHLAQNTRNFCFQPFAAAMSFSSPYRVHTLRYCPQLLLSAPFY